jgi:hypothetical protein
MDFAHSWTDGQGSGVHAFQRSLNTYNHKRLAAGLGEEAAFDLRRERKVRTLERQLIAHGRSEIAQYLENVPRAPVAFVRWFEALKERGPGQGDPLFPWLAHQASLQEMRWFLAQEVAGEAGFDDLLSMTQIKMPPRPRLEMARNYWDEMGRGEAKGMHGPMLARLAAYFGIAADVENTVPEALALANMMMALAFNRSYAFHAVGALGVIELTAPGRAAYVVQGLDRLGVPKKQSHYFALHAVLDVKHSQAWNKEVLAPLVAEDPRRARAIGEGALLRLWCGAQCFARYRRHFGLSNL